MRKLLSLFIVTATLFLLGCGASSPIQESSVSTSQQQNSDIPVRNAIIRAGHQYGWRMKIINRGKIMATRYQRGYMAKTEIKYTKKSYSLKFMAATRKTYYNDWVAQLDDAIKTQLDKS